MSPEMKLDLGNVSVYIVKNDDKKLVIETFYLCNECKKSFTGPKGLTDSIKHYVDKHIQH